MVRKIGLPEFAAIEASSGSLPSERDGSRAESRSPQERAQQMWDLFQDLKHAWVQFVRANKAERTDLFRASATFKALQPRLHALYADLEVRTAWEDGMKKHADQWEGINGTWTEYRALEKNRAALEARYDELQKEKFDERATPRASRRRTLADDLAEIELALADIHINREALRQKSPELAAKILASELAERHKELKSPDGFMWFESRRQILEALEAKIADKETLRLIVLEGQAGSGKTSFARTLARKFTGHDSVEVTIKAKTKVDRQLLADETLDPAHPVTYRPILQAITGKSRPEDAPSHDGRVAFTDELNKGDNDEVGDLATIFDGMKAGGKTRYGAMGANPEDKVQPNALVIAAQNPAGARFLNRTKFTPEVQRKLDIVQLDYFSQTPENPELFEAFLVLLMDADGRVQAQKDEIGPEWTKSQEETIEEEKNNAGRVIGRFKQQKLKTAPTDGGALWRMAQMLHQSYENLSKRKNDLTDANPDAHLQGRVLPPGDVFSWLQFYKKEIKKGRSLEEYLSTKFMEWIGSSFTADHDMEDRRLYLELAQRYGIVEKRGDEYKARRVPNIHIDLLTPRDVAELSPRVPRKKEYIGARIETPAFTLGIMDWTGPDGVMHERLQFRYEPSADDGKRFRQRGLPDIFQVVGIIKECDEAPELVGQAYIKKVEATAPTPELSYAETEARRLGLERLEVRGNREAQKLIEQVIAGTIDIETPAGQKQFIDSWKAKCPDIPPPCVSDKNDWQYLTRLKNKKIIKNLEGAVQTAPTHFDADEVLLVDSWQETDYNATDAAKKHTSKLLKELLGTESTVNIKREDLDAALWDGDPTNRVPTAKHKALLLKLGVDPATTELRPIRQDEYARLASSKGWGQHSLWTNFDHYFLGDGGDRRGLHGGHAEHGGPSCVGNSWRGLALDDLAVRLVLARKL